MTVRGKEVSKMPNGRVRLRRVKSRVGVRDERRNARLLDEVATFDHETFHSTIHLVHLPPSLMLSHPA